MSLDLRLADAPGKPSALRGRFISQVTGTHGSPSEKRFRHAETQRKFAGTWEAKWKDKEICTLKLRDGEHISGEMEACNINADANGDLQEPESNDHSDPPSPILNAKLEDDTLKFEMKDDDDVLKFEMKLLGDGRPG